MIMCPSGTTRLPVDCCCCFSRTTCLPADCCYCFSELALYNHSKRVGLVQRGHHHLFFVLFHIHNLLSGCVFWSIQGQHPYFWTVPTFCQSIEYIKPNFHKVSPWSVFHFYLRGSGYHHDNHDTDFCLPL
jgi:hypothetical protein